MSEEYIVLDPSLIERIREICSQYSENEEEEEKCIQEEIERLCWELCKCDEKQACSCYDYCVANSY